jgi:hypothetical protein
LRARDKTLGGKGVPYAHSREEAAETDWQPLGEHLRSVAELTRRSADVWGAGALRVSCRSVA